MVLNLDQIKVHKLTTQLDAVLEEMLFNTQSFTDSIIGTQLDIELKWAIRRLQDLGCDVESLYN